MNSKKIEIEVPNGKKAEWVNDVLTLVDEKPKNVMKRVKTFEDAYNELNEKQDRIDGNEHPLCLAYDSNEIEDKDLIAYLKLRIITAALNEGWEPKFTKNEYRYFPWFCLYTQEEIDEMSEEDKARVVYRSYYNAYANGGVAFAYSYNDSTASHAYIGSRLAFKTRELAEYAGKQFTEIYADFNFKPE